jgi:hypothetical protein
VHAHWGGFCCYITIVVHKKVVLGAQTEFRKIGCESVLLPILKRLIFSFNFTFNISGSVLRMCFPEQTYTK